MENLKLVIIDKFEPLDISANVARDKWAARVRKRRRGGYVWPCRDWWTSEGQIVREYAAIRRGNGPTVLYLEGMPRKCRAWLRQLRACAFRVRWSSWRGSGCVGTFDDFGRAWACLIETAKEYDRKGDANE